MTIVPIRSGEILSYLSGDVAEIQDTPTELRPGTGPHHNGD